MFSIVFKRHILICLLLYTAAATAGDVTITNSMYFIGGEYSLNSRSGRYKFSDGKFHEVSLDNLHMGGLIFGKRIALSKFLRLQLPLIFDYGTITTDTFDLMFSDGIKPTALRRNYYHVGIIPQLQFPLQVAPRAQFYLGAGFGFHMMRFVEKENRLDKDIAVSDIYPESSTNFPFSLNAGAGLDLIFNAKYGLVLNYNFQYWNPVKYKTSHDLFLYKPVNYHERFLTHTFGICLLVNR